VPISHSGGKYAPDLSQSRNIVVEKHQRQERRARGGRETTRTLPA
jgi:hypothetical protein